MKFFSSAAAATLVALAWSAAPLASADGALSANRALEEHFDCAWQTEEGPTVKMNDRSAARIKARHQLSTQIMKDFGINGKYTKLEREYVDKKRYATNHVHASSSDTWVAHASREIFVCNEGFLASFTNG